MTGGTDDAGRSPIEYLRTATGGIAANADIRTLLVAYLLLLLTSELYGKALPLLFRELSVPVAVLGIATSIGNAVEALASPVAGAAADEYDRFGLAAVAALVVATALAGLAVAGSVGPPADSTGSAGATGTATGAHLPVVAAVVVLVVVYSAGRISLNTALTPAVSDALDDEFAGIGWGVRDVAVYLGSAVGLAIGGAVLSVLGAVRFAFLALVPVVLALSALLWGRREEPDGRGHSVAGGPDPDGGRNDGDGTAAGDETVAEEGSEGSTTVRAVVRSLTDPSVPSVPRPRLLVRFAAVTGLSNAAFGMSVFLLPLYAGEVGLDGRAFLLLYGWNRQKVPSFRAGIRAVSSVIFMPLGRVTITHTTRHVRAQAGTIGQYRRPIPCLRRSSVVERGWIPTLHNQVPPNPSTPCRKPGGNDGDEWGEDKE